MKKVLIALVLLTSVQFAVLAQEPAQGEPQAEEQLSPVGFWQLCVLSQGQSGELEMNLMPLLKIIGEEGSYTEVLIRTTGGGCSVVTEAKYEIKDDSTMTVTTEGHRGGPMGGGMPQQGEGGEMPDGMPQPGQGGGMQQSQDLKYSLYGEQWMMLEYTSRAMRMPGAEEAGEGELVQEFWMRVGSNPRLKSVIKEALQGGSAAAVEESIDQDEQRMQQRMQQRGQGGQRGGQRVNTSNNSMYNQTNSWMDED